MSERFKSEIYLIDQGDEIVWCDDPEPSDYIEKVDVCGYVKKSEIDALRVKPTAENIIEQYGEHFACILIKDLEDLLQ